MVIYHWKFQTPGKLIFKMIRVGNYYWKLKTPDKLIFNMIKGGAGVGGIIDLVQWSEGDLSTRFLPFMCDVKAAYTILTTLIPLEEYLHIATVSFFS